MMNMMICDNGLSVSDIQNVVSYTFCVYYVFCCEIDANAE